MADINPDDLPWNYIYVTDNGEYVTDNGQYVIFGINPFPPAPDYNGGGGNRLLCTSYIVDMGYPRLPGGATASGPVRDRKGRTVVFED